MITPETVSAGRSRLEEDPYLTTSRFAVSRTLLAAVLIFVLAILLSAGSILAQQEANPANPVEDSLTTTVAQDTLPPELFPAAPTNVKAIDKPNDEGHAIVVTWDLSSDDHKGGKVKEYKILRASVQSGELGKFKVVGSGPPEKPDFEDGGTDDDSTYVYKVESVNNLYENNEPVWEVASASDLSSETHSSAQWFNTNRVNVMVGVLLLCFFIIYYISQAKAGKALFIRKIAGLEAVDEAVGRATEMGKKIFYIPGTQDMDNVQTIAGVTILGRVAEMAARYETWLEVPVSRSLVLVTAKEMVKEAYAKVGRPDAFHEDQVHYLTDDQFGYAAGIDGMMVREHPATVFYMGAFYAESLILAETGNSIGAIQIAGTGMPSQLPFFVAACDYTLIGEELFAASAYLSREPKLLGSLKGQDIGKAVILVAIIVGIFLETFGIWNFAKLFSVQ